MKESDARSLRNSEFFRRTFKKAVDAVEGVKVVMVVEVVEKNCL